MEKMEKVRRILVLDGSRVVRATLSKHLKEDFEVIEESSGESAWQTLMLDAGISAVISGIHPLKLDAHDLLARLRASSIRRTVRDGKLALVETAPCSKTDPSALGVAPDLVIEPAAAETANQPQSRDRFNSVLSKLVLADPLGQAVCILVFRIDNRAALIERFGEDVAALIDARFAKLLMSKVGPHDQVGHCVGDRLAIVSHDVDLKQGERFGKQVCRSLVSGQITIRGQKVKLTASVGVASTSDDKVSRGNELYTLADQRLNQALVCGGNTVAIEYKAACPLHCRDRNTAKLIEALVTPQEAAIRVNLGTIGLKILPILRAMNQEMSLGLSLTEIEQQLEKRAERERATV